MAKFKNEAGEEVEAFTQEELDAQKAEAVEAAKAAAVEEYKAANPPKTAEQTAAEKKATDDAAAAANEPVAKLAATVEKLERELGEARVAGFARTYAGADPAKQAEFTTKFGRLTGYADTPEGMVERAADAAKLIGVDPASVDISGVTGTGGGRNVDGKPAPAATEADKIVQKALGITPEDVTKYGEGAKEGAAAAEEGKK